MAEMIEQTGLFPGVRVVRKPSQQALQGGLKFLHPDEIAAHEHQRKHHDHRVLVPDTAADLGHDPANNCTEYRRNSGQKHRHRQGGQDSTQRLFGVQGVNEDGRHPRQQDAHKVGRQERQQADGQNHPRRDGHREQKLIILGREQPGIPGERPHDDRHQQSHQLHGQKVQPPLPDGYHRLRQRPRHHAETEHHQQQNAAEEEREPDRRFRAAASAGLAVVGEERAQLHELFFQQSLKHCRPPPVPRRHFPAIHRPLPRPSTRHG